MRVVITGGTGLIGHALAQSLLADQHEVIILSRSARQAQKSSLPGAQYVQWDARTASGWGDLAQGAVIVNLAGENLGAGRWNKERKQRILSSRVGAGEAVMDAIRSASVKPHLLIQASAVGYYGPRGAEPVTEEAGPGRDFQARVVWDWEASTAAAPRYGVRRVVLRTGLPLTTKGGVFPKLLLPFKLLIAGGPLGSGRQYLPWIHMDDYIRAVRFLMEREDAEGAYNLSAPNPVPQKEFAKTLGSVMGRPSIMPAPAFALKAVLGEMAALVLEGQRQLPKRLLNMGFEFQYPELAPALRDILDNRK